MNYDKLWLPRLIQVLSFLFFTTLLFTSCQGDLPNVPTEQTFTKAKLEKLGSQLRAELLNQHEYLPEMAPYDTSVYWYVQTLYGQATSNMHLDKQSPAYNKWDQNRLWKAYIISNDAERIAFTLPGGDFFISTGMLKSMKKDYELYALLSFEASLMNDGHLLAQWVREYNSLTINNLIEEKDQPNPLTAEELAQEMTSFVFDPETVEKVDQAAVDNTCMTSILDPVGLLPILANPDFSNSKWLQTRPSYDGRASSIPGMRDDFCTNAAHGNGNYQRFVLNRIP